MASETEHEASGNHAAAAEPHPVPADERERVARAAAVLSPLERDVLALSAGHGFRVADIAARLGLSERRAERILARALRKFSLAMDERPRPWWCR